MDPRIIWLGVGSFAMSTVGFVFSSLLPAIAGETHVSVPSAGYLIMAFSLAYAVGAPVLSAVMGEADRRRVLALTILAFVCGNIVAATSGSFGGLLAAQILMGGTAGLYAATAQATAIALAGPEHRARAIAVVLGGTTFAVALGAPAGSLIANLWGWRGTFVAIALLGVACASILWVRLPRDMHGMHLPLSQRFAAITMPGIAPSLVVTLLYLAGGFVMVSYLAPLAMDGAGMSAMALPALLLAFGAGAVLGNLASGYLSDRFGATMVVTLALLLSSAICVVMASVITFLPHALAGPILIGLMVPWGIIGWSFPPAQASRIVGRSPAIAHLTLSLNASAMYFGIALGTVVGGRILEFSNAASLGFFAAGFPLVALAVLLATRKSMQPVAAPRLAV
ncbi:MFS transporter [Corticibacterium sp. UT-5YL-CI-8]|nr:MFS transporter [Tianweitania sp. UT-5YL-CI-8]